MKPFFCFILSIVLLYTPASAQAPISPWNMQELYQTPLMYPSDSCKMRGFESFFYEGAIYKTKPTKVFAYYKTPEGKVPPGGWPAVICVHGGGGTAFPEWVQAWVDHGYAAIAMDVEGHLPKGEFPNREWHADGGPPRITTFGDIELADREQWFYHAVADVVRANSLLRSFSEINKNSIGIHGISWGAVITSAVMGLDNRLSFAIPVYGCGFLYESTVSNFERYIKTMTATQLESYKTKWDPSIYIPYAKMPVLWYTGSNDGAFPLNIWQKSVQAGRSSRFMCIPVTSEHGHIWNQPEIFAFADMVAKKGKALMTINSPLLQKNTASVTVSNVGVIKKAVVCYTEDTGYWQNRKWLQIPATVKKNRVSMLIPKNTTAFYFNLTDERKLSLSSSYLNLEQAQ